ncbi:hypothetical protein CKA34_11300 [Rhizobium sp. 11515TR]|nr:hypothetical protein CKA34_11300 [Rhizobium sp. 11515TR]
MLNAFYPRRWGLIEMTWFDHLVVHTGDLSTPRARPGYEAPSSLHPDLPNRVGELLVRRPLIERSLRAMQRVHLVEAYDTDEGLLFGSSEEAPSFLECLQSTYSVALKERAAWLAARFRDMDVDDIKFLVEDRIGRWTAEFQNDDRGPSTGLPT